ncbi:hypothetical protein GGQ11_000335 [Salinibacter ruber]|nr:hypothetical protein [Salinibacter ruber]MCS4116735.1 hypothetical protein [Salinibacter ruber]MCS4152846.1 hypothetical protein [Salinibacter ruber]MCS4168659.1 hypothetical protein [Salinibacter ruber]MCS4185431.1 hypothetical protein [Salinibacter ruber]
MKKSIYYSYTRNIIQSMYLRVRILRVLLSILRVIDLMLQFFVEGVDIREVLIFRQKAKSIMG